LRDLCRALLQRAIQYSEYRLFYMALLQKRPITFRSLLIVATPYSDTVLFYGYAYTTRCSTLQVYAYTIQHTKTLHKRPPFVGYRALLWDIGLFCGKQGSFVGYRADKPCSILELHPRVVTCCCGLFEGLFCKRVEFVQTLLQKRSTVFLCVFFFFLQALLKAVFSGM